MFGAELVIVLLAIYLGARLGGIGIGFAGGLGVLVLTLIFQIKPGAIPFDVIEIIMAVIAAIAAMQVAGGMDYLVNERQENIGARRLHTVLERLLDTLSYEAPDRDGQSVTIDRAYVDAHLGELVQDPDLSRYIL